MLRRSEKNTTKKKVAVAKKKVAVAKKKVAVVKKKVAPALSTTSNFFFSRSNFFFTYCNFFFILTVNTYKRLNNHNRCVTKFILALKIKASMIEKMNFGSKS